MDSRAEFESEWSKRFSDHKLARMQTMGGDLHDEYRDSRVNYAWIMWQASRQELEGEAAMWSLSFNGKPANHFTTYPTRGKAEDYIARCKIGEKEPEKVNIEVVPLYTHPARRQA